MSWLILGRTRGLAYHSLTGVLDHKQAHHESVLIREKTKNNKEKNNNTKGSIVTPTTSQEGSLRCGRLMEALGSLNANSGLS